MRVRFQADADFNQIIVAAVVRRTPTIDFRTAKAAGLAGLDDAAVLAIAAEDGRILVTHDQAQCRPNSGNSHARTPAPASLSFRKVSRSEKRPTR